MIKKLLSALKRPLQNLLALAIIVAVGFAAYGNYQANDKTEYNEGQQFPKLTSLKTIPIGGLDINTENSLVQIALEISLRDNPDNFVPDIVEVYRWGRSHFKPVLCGPEHPPNLCVVGYVDIVLVGRQDIITTNGRDQGYVTIAEMGLDQIQIDRMLRHPPTDFEGLMDFQSRVAEETLGTGGWIQAFDPPMPFTGFK